MEPGIARSDRLSPYHSGFEASRIANVRNRSPRPEGGAFRRHSLRIQHTPRKEGRIRTLDALSAKNSSINRFSRSEKFLKSRNQ